MSSTILTNKCAAAFRDPASGKVIYAMFVETYESNVSPKTPRWGCCQIGEYADVMKWVFGGAGDCEGGTLRSRGGHIKPENYIEAWKQKLNKPVALPDFAISLKVGGEEHGAVQSAAVRAALGEVECSAVRIEQLCAEGEHLLSMHEDAGVVLALIRAGAISTWRAVSHGIIRNSEVDASLAPVPTKGRVEVPFVIAYKIGNGDVLVKNGDAPLRHAGREYRAVGDFVESVYALEMAQAGCAKGLIALFRETVRNAPEVPPGTMAVINRDAERMGKWQFDCANTLAKLVSVEDDRSTFQCSPGLLDNAGHYHLSSLPSDCVEWLLPEQQEPFRRQAGFYF